VTKHWYVRTESAERVNLYLGALGETVWADAGILVAGMDNASATQRISLVR
jgi:hypothetical protein